MKYSREQLVEMLIEDEKQYYDMPDSDWEMIESEYNTELEKMGIDGADKLTVVGDDDGDVVYDFGLDKKVVVDGMGVFRRMFWYDNE